MKLEDFQKQLDEDVKIDGTKLQYEASNNPVVYARWLRIYSDVKKQLLVLDHQKKKSLKDRLDYYTGRGDEVCMTVYEKSELKVVLAADKNLATIDSQIAYYQILLDFASKALDIIKARGFSIKNMVEIRSLESGK